MERRKKMNERYLLTNVSEIRNYTTIYGRGFILDRDFANRMSQVSYKLLEINLWMMHKILVEIKLKSI